MNKRPPQTALPKPVRRSFYLVLCALPFLLILALEALLRLTGFGSSYPLFVPAPAPGYLQPNPLLVQRYVNDPRQAPPVAPDSQYFLAEKPQGALRLVVAGESTAAGFPYGRFGSPAALLQQRLKLQSAEQPIEVISTAMAAINSYTVLDLMPELLAIQPDAILLYVGHNEYVGLLGVGSQFQASPNRQLTLWWLQLKQWRLYQWIQRGMQAILPPPADLAGQEATHPQGDIQDQTQGNIQNKSQGKTTMAQLASQSGIALGSDTYQAGVQQFRDNLAAIAELAREAGVPLIVTSLVSNEKALPPFLTVHSQAASAVEPILAAADLSQHLAQNLAQNLAQYPALLKTAPEDALLHYQYGLALLQNRQPEAALQAFQHAKDLDLLR
ncbi:MAG: SGNH/GDSL hydrolase family protein, partial [Rheinheimera sp.]